MSHRIGTVNRVLEPVLLRDGREISLAPMTGHGFEVLEEIERLEKEKAGSSRLLVFEAAQTCLPSLTIEEVKQALTPAEAWAVIGLATGSYRELAEAASPPTPATGLPPAPAAPSDSSVGG